MTPLEARTFPAALEALRSQAASTAVIVPDGGPELTYGELLDTVAWLAEVIGGAELPTGPLALCLPNGPELLCAFLAIASAGRAAIPLNPGLTAALAADQLADGQVRALIVPAGEAGPARDAATQLGIPVWELAAASAGIALSGPVAAGGELVACEPDTVALLLQTSGTTGKPKWVPLTHRNLLASVAHIAETYQLGAEDVALVVMPLFHVHGLVGVSLSTLFSGGSQILPPRFSAGGFWGWVQAYRPTWYSAVPTIHQIVLTRPELEAALADSRLRFVRSCSSALMPATMHELERRLGVPVLQAYGMTEAAHQIASQPLPPGERRPGSVGQPTGLQVRIIDAGGRPLPAGESGEVALSGENVMGGYLDNPLANAAAFADGWLRTGDLGYLDEQGNIMLIGRSKEMINRAGEKIAPSQIDAVLLDAPNVTAAVSFGVPDAMYGEVVHAALTGDVDVAEVAEYCRRELPPFMVPVRFHVLEAIPTGPTGKPSRVELPKTLGLL